MIKMIDVVPNAGEEVTDWVAKRANARSFGDSVCIGYYKSNKIVGGIVFNEYRVEDIVMSAAFENKECFTKENIAHVFHYPFQQLKCHRLTAYTETDNKKANKILKQLGFTQEGTLREIGENKQDANIYGMLRKECKWIGENNG